MAYRSMTQPTALPIISVKPKPYALRHHSATETRAPRVWLAALQSFAREVIHFWADEIVYATMDTLRVILYLRVRFQPTVRVKRHVVSYETFEVDPLVYDMGELARERAQI